MMNKELLFIQGVKKTGTSTLVGILNCHPDIFLLYEVMLDNTWISKYGNQILSRYPEAREYFSSTTPIEELYRDFFLFIEQKNPRYRYRYFGDKVIDFDPFRIQIEEPLKIIFTHRDIRSWLVKKQIQRDFRTDLDIIPAAVDYTSYCLRSYLRQNSLVVRMETLIRNNKQMIENLSEFLELDLSKHAEQWWNQVGHYAEDDPKQMVRWYEGHPSSKTKPSVRDTRVQINPHSFWDELLPIFDKYYQAAQGSHFSRREIESDLDQIHQLRKFSPLPVHQAYQDYSTISLGKNTARGRGGNDSCLKRAVLKLRNLFDL